MSDHPPDLWASDVGRRRVQQIVNVVIINFDKLTMKRHVQFGLHDENKASVISVGSIGSDGGQTHIGGDNAPSQLWWRTNR